MKKAKVLVSVHRGIVTIEACPDFVEVEVRDFDTNDLDDDYPKEYTEEEIDEANGQTGLLSNKLFSEIRLEDVDLDAKPFTTGAHIMPIQYMLPDGEERVGWMIDAFEDDTFYDGDYVNVHAHGNTFEDIWKIEK